MTRPAAEDRLRRILAVVPWVAGADGPRLTEVCARFGYASEQELQDDLNLLFMCGVPPYTPDSLIEVDIADGRVWIRYADWFARPLRLTAAEALTLVASSTALLSEGGDVERPLARGLAKLARALGVHEDVVDVTLDVAPGALDELRRAADDRRQVEIDYYAFGRDETTTRVVDPHLVFSTGGEWYLAGYCHRAGADRLFRVDRVRRVSTLSSTFRTPPRTTEPPVFDPAPGGPVIVLDLEPTAAWVATQYPARAVTELGDGRIRVELDVSGEAWLARLLLRLGRDARVVDGDASPAARAAARVRARYQAR
ncbi:MAG: helix-turn-helix transcriptional regulator [Acidimicrobiales bacterium]